MKKSISLFLALIMILSMSTSALALEAESTGHISTSNAGSISQNDYSVAFEITYTWADCYAAMISISNLSEKNIGPMVPIIEHNRQDIISLAGFLKKMYEDVN